MSATTFSALSALLIHSTVPIDSDPGIRNGMEAEGLLVKSISYKPSRDKTSYSNHRKWTVAHVLANPQLVLSVDADITLLAGALAAKHPGEPIHKSYVQDFYPELAHRFQTSLGYFIYDEPETTSPQGALNSGKFSLIWFAPAVNTSQQVAAPAAPE